MKQPLDKAALKRRRDGIFATLALLVVAALVFLGVRAQRSVTIKKGTTTIENGAYANKSMLRSVTIPDTVTGIGERAFSGCSELRSVEIPDSVTEIGDRAFEGCHDLSSVTLPDGVQVIQRYTFDGCRRLESIVIPDSVTLIEAGAFSGCEKLASVTLGSGVEKVEKDAFRGCTALTRVVFAEGTKEIHGWFSECDSLTDIAIPDSATAIDSQAFWGCDGLTGVRIPDGVTEIGSQAFKNCSGLEEVHIGSGVREIGWEAFNYCESLEKVHIGSGVREIGLDAFADCESLTEFTIAPDNSALTAVGDIILDGEMTRLVYYPPALIERNRALIPEEWNGENETLDAASALGGGDSRILPLQSEGEVDMSLYARLPEDRRTLTPEEADCALVVSVGSEERDDYVVRGSFEKVYGVYDTVTDVFLCAKDGAYAKLSSIRHSPPESGEVSRFGGLAMGNVRGDRATTEEIWEKIGALFE